MSSDPHEVERLVLQLIGLVRRREVLRRQGASDDELEANRIETERLRWRLASVVRRRETGAPRAA